MENLSKKTVFFLLLALSLLSFAATLKIGFIWDDHQMITANPYVKGFTVANFKHNLLSNAFNQEGASYYRPLQLVSYMLDFKLFRLEPFGWHVVNFLFHFLNSFLIFLLLRKMELPEKVSFLAAAFFAVNPIGVEQMIIIAGRAELMTFTFSLLSALLFLEGGRLNFALSLFSFALACLSKESGVITPVFIMLALWFSGKSPWDRKIILFFLLIPFYLFLRKAAVSAPLVEINAWDLAVNLVLRMPYIFFNYLYKTLLPFDLHSHNLVTGFNVYSYAVLLAGIAASKYFVFVKSRDKILVFSFLWYFAALLPKFPLFGSQALALDHWAYPANFGVFLVLAYGLSKLEERRFKTSLALSFFLISVWAAFSNHNISLRDTDMKIYENAVRYPTSSKVYYNLSREYYLRGEFHRARRALERVMDANSGDEMFVNAYALSLWKTGDAAGALETMFSLTKKGAKTPASYLNLASIYAEDANYDAAAEALRAGLKLFPEDENLNLYMARVRGLTGKKEEARRLLLGIIGLNPYNPEALLNLGMMAFARKEYGESGKYFEKLLEVDKNNAAALEYLEKIKRLSNE